MNPALSIFFITFLIYSWFYYPTFLYLFFSLIGLYLLISRYVLYRNCNPANKSQVRIATWNKHYDPQIFAKIRINLSKISPFLEQYNTKNKSKVTLTVFFIKMIGNTLAKFPEVNGFIRFGNYVSKQTVDMVSLCQIDDGSELGNCRLSEVDKLTLAQIAEKQKEAAEKLRAKKDSDYNTKMLLFHLVPTWLGSIVCDILAYLSGIGIEAKMFGIKKFEFGSCVVTSVGSIGLRSAFAPLIKCMRVPFIVTICGKKEKWVKTPKGMIKRTTASLNFTIDSRYVDSKIVKAFYEELLKFAAKPHLLDN